MKLQIKCWFTGNVLFEHEAENNTLQLTVEAAVSAGAYLASANLAGADLARANLTRANLANANLTGANLAGANLARAYLASANLTGANLAGANLANANLTRANLTGANLAGADLARAKNADHAIAQTVLTPEGALIGWKACNRSVLVKLQIPADAKRSNASGRKCRAEFVDVLEVIGAEVGVTDTHGPFTEYSVGARVHCHKWDDNRWNECSGGIHFFITRAEAEAWN